MWLILLALACFLAAVVNYTETDWDYNDDRTVRRHKAFGWLIAMIGMLLIILRLSA